tara:strand:+ start:155 stop:1642 length:1488 start_codon:yes stop_codon:yes gene_type:complete
MGSQHRDSYDFAGDYNLNGIILQAHDGTGGRFGEGGVDIMPMVQELNIYEAITQTAVYGTLVIVDSTNLIANLPIQGTERLFFKLSTPGTSKVEHIIDASEETGHPFYVYKISNKQQAKQGTLVYTIHFASREFMRNIRTKVSQAYSGNLSSMVQQIMADKQGLDSRKTLYFEETKNQDKFVMPNIPPFQAISLVAKRALPKYGQGVGYYFYETTKGFYFQSWESMCADKIKERDPIETYYYQPRNITDPALERDANETKVMQDLRSVETYKFVNNFHDTAAAQALGTYGHRVISYNLYNKSFTPTDYNYHKEFNNMVHVDYKNDEGLTGTSPQVRENPVDFDNNSVSDYAESMVSLSPTTQFLHDEPTGGYGTDVADDGRFEGIRNSQRMQINAGTTIEMTVPGQTQIQPGEIIHFELRPVETEGETVDKKPYDPQYSGRYIITKVRHRVTKQDYKMVFECKKDSVRESIPGKRIREFVGTANNENTRFSKLNT